MYQRFTDRARKVLQLANQEAVRSNHEYIGSEDVLLGLIGEGEGVAANALKHLKVDLRKVRIEVDTLLQSGSDIAIAASCRKAGQIKEVVDYSILEALNLNHDYVGTEHILLGLLRDQHGVAAHVLINMGLTLEKVREETLKLLGRKS